MTKRFSFDTVQNFDDHIDLSIPNYSFCAEQVKKFAEYFVRDYTSVVDLGCSTGKLIKEMTKSDKSSYYGYDISKNLLPLETEKEPNVFWKDEDLVELAENTLNEKTNILSLVDDLKSDTYFKHLSTFPKDISYAFSLFTLQFLPPVKRQLVINAIYRNMLPGSAFVSCEKVYSTNAKLQDITNSIYYEFKNKSFTADEILSKERDLRRIMTPQSLEKSMEQLSVIGKPNVFWMSYNFVGIIVIKEK